MVSVGDGYIWKIMTGKKRLLKKRNQYYENLVILQEGKKEMSVVLTAGLY